MNTETAVAPADMACSKRIEGDWVNDRHSQMNGTNVFRIAQPQTLEELLGVLDESRSSRIPIIASGGRHAMGAQQFGTDTIALDMTGLKRVLRLDLESGMIDLEAGITWIELQTHLDNTRSYHGRNAGAHGWAIAQKQTGADDLSLGGSVSANVHGRGLTKHPIIEDIESLTVITSQGDMIECSRRTNPDLFQLVVGGYGLFGIIYSVRLRLVLRQRLERVVRV